MNESELKTTVGEVMHNNGMAKSQQAKVLIMLCCSSTMWPRKSYTISLSLNFFIYNIDEKIVIGISIITITMLTGMFMDCMSHPGSLTLSQFSLKVKNVTPSHCGCI